jgi:hypothetical protein
MRRLSEKGRAMRGRVRYFRAATSFVVALPLIASQAVAPGAMAQTSPSCQPGYYYASDGYCYPQPQPVYAAPPPVYDTAPPAYSAAPDVAGVAIGLGLGLLVGALANDHGGGGDHHSPPRAHDVRHDDRGHH